MKKNLTEIVFILDRSGSMAGLEDDTIGGFNAMIQKQKGEDGEAYARAAGEMKDKEKRKGILKKAGYFQTEQPLVEEIYHKTGMELHHRYPLTYIMEAADDIAYCMSDIADGIEKRILTVEKFCTVFRREWEKAYPGEKIPVKLPDPENMHSFNRDISVPWTKRAAMEAAGNYIRRHDEVFAGTADALISDDRPMGKVLETMKCVSRKLLYPSIEAESIELTGYAVMTGILKHYERLMKMPCADFGKLAVGERVEDADVERRLFNRIGQRCVRAYQYAVDALDHSAEDFPEKEWWLRVHLLVDHLSGMTDEFALETYQMLEGINLMRV